MIRDCALALLAGLLCGAVFAAARLPVPAPPTVAGVLGVAGVAGGWWAVSRLLT